MSLVLYYYPPTGKLRGGAGHVAIGYHYMDHKRLIKQLIVDLGGQKDTDLNAPAFGEPELYFLPPTLDSKDYYLPSILQNEHGKGEQLLEKLENQSYLLIAYNCAHGAAGFLNLLGFKIYPKAYVPALIKNIVKEQYSFEHMLKNIMDHKCDADDKRWETIKNSLQPMSEQIKSQGFFNWQSQVNWSEVTEQLLKLRDECQDHRGFFSTHCCFFQRKPPISFQKLDKLANIAAMYKSQQSLKKMLVDQEKARLTLH